MLRDLKKGLDATQQLVWSRLSLFCVRETYQGFQLVRVFSKMTSIGSLNIYARLLAFHEGLFSNRTDFRRGNQSSSCFYASLASSFSVAVEVM